MNELVDKKQLIKEIKAGKAIKFYPDGESFFDQDLVLAIIEDCTLSPAGLAEILKGKAWVLEELKEYIRYVLDATNIDPTKKLDSIWVALLNLESRAPVSKLAKQTKENERKAEAWDSLYGKVKEWKEAFGENVPSAFVVRKGEMDKLLSQSKIPPKAEEEKR